MATLTIRQMQVLEFVKNQLENSGKTPSRTRIANALSFRSTKEVEKQLQVLAEKGLIKLEITGQIRILTPPDNVELPVVGRLPEGQNAPQWLKNMLQALTQPRPPMPARSAAWVQQQLFG